MRIPFYFVCSLLFLSSIAGCKKDNPNSVPNIAVDIYIYSSQPSFIDISVVGGHANITGGVRGILVYRKSNSEFMAYDRNCTFQSTNPNAIVYVDPSNIIVTDSSCHSKFSIFDGNVTQGPAGLPLKAYNTTFDGNVLHIYN